MGQAVDALGINLPQLIAQVANFVVLLVVLRLVLYKPVLKMLDDRRERIAEGLGAADKAREEAVAAQANVQEQLDKARQQGQEIIANAQAVATRLHEEAREQSAQDRGIAIERARAEIQQERDRAISELRREFAAVTISAAEKVIGQSLDKDAHERVIEESLAQSQFGGS